LVDPAAAVDDLGAAWSTDLSALFGGLDLADMTANLSDLLNGFDPTALSTEWANVMEDFAAAFVPDWATSALTAF
jgi:hypothetical protein